MERVSNSLLEVHVLVEGHLVVKACNRMLVHEVSPYPKQVTLDAGVVGVDVVHSSLDDRKATRLHDLVERQSEDWEL